MPRYTERLLGLYRKTGWDFADALWGLYRGSKGDIENTAFLEGVCKSILTLNLKTWKNQQLRRNIKIRAELVIFYFHFPEIREAFIFTICGLMEISGNP